jgi:hypothetical protein
MKTDDKGIVYIGGTTLHDIQGIEIVNSKGKNNYDTCIIKLYSKDGYCYEVTAFGKPDITFDTSIKVPTDEIEHDGIGLGT